LNIKQNIPKGNKSDVKTLFVSRFGKWVTNDFGTMVWVPHGKIIQSDFSSLEVYVQAILTKCKQLIADLKAGLDMHCVRLAAKEGMPYEEVLKLAKGFTDSDGVRHEAVKEWDYKRTAAKEYSFQSAFGAGDPAIAAATGMDIEQVAELRAADEKRYPEIPKFYQELAALIKHRRKVFRTIPHDQVPGVMCSIGSSWYRTPDGKLYTYIEKPAPAYLVKRGIAASFSPTEQKNYVVQGTGGEWAKAAMWLAVRAFYAVKNFGGLALLVNQVHDAIYTDADDSVALRAAALLHACMEGASDFMAYWFKWDLPLAVPSDTTWGNSMMDEESIPGLKELAKPLRDMLRREYMGGFVPSF
jgi:DNA polymerase I-like protein with 3'-5' exonuclease and polymerase domains